MLLDPPFPAGRSTGGRQIRLWAHTELPMSVTLSFPDGKGILVLAQNSHDAPCHLGDNIIDDCPQKDLYLARHIRIRHGQPRLIHTMNDGQPRLILTMNDGQPRLILTMKDGQPRLILTMNAIRHGQPRLIFTMKDVIRHGQPRLNLTVNPKNVGMQLIWKAWAQELDQCQLIWLAVRLVRIIQ